MLSNPKLGTRVIVHYAQKWIDVPHINTKHLQDCKGIVVVVCKGRPRNHGVNIDGTVYSIPCGNLKKVEAVP